MDRKEMKIAYSCIIALCIFAAAIFFGDSVGTDAEVVAGPGTEAWASYVVTAYCPCEKCCGKWSDGYFANNEPVSFPAIAAPPNIPCGTRINVPGYGVAVVKDRGGAIKGNKLDVYFPTHDAALEWGRQVLDIMVFK